jgi:hypothetical protein
VARAIFRRRWRQQFAPRRRRFPFSVAGPANLSRTASDTAQAVDAATRSLTLPRSAADTAQASDAAARSLADARTTADTANATDATTRTLRYRDPRRRVGADGSEHGNSVGRDIPHCRPRPHLNRRCHRG